MTGLKSISQNKRPLARMMMSTKQSLIHNETIWKSTYLRNFLSLDLVINCSINIETRESCCLKWSFSLTLCEIPWRFSSILPNVKTSLTLCKIPWQFPDLEKFYFSLTFPWWLWTLLECLEWTGYLYQWKWLVDNHNHSRGNYTAFKLLSLLYTILDLMHLPCTEYQSCRNQIHKLSDFQPFKYTSTWHGTYFEWVE